MYNFIFAASDINDISINHIKMCLYINKNVAMFCFVYTYVSIKVNSFLLSLFFWALIYNVMIRVKENATLSLHESMARTYICMYIIACCKSSVNCELRRD